LVFITKREGAVMNHEINSSALQLVKYLQSIASVITGHNLSLTYTYYQRNRIDYELTEIKCSATFDCSSFIDSQAIPFNKRYLYLYESLLSASSKDPCSFQKSAFSPFYNALQTVDLFGSLLHDDNESEFEAGGGSGLGFQVYCDEKMILSTGGGGGGGFYYNTHDRSMTNFGGGGGGGIQLQIDTDKWISSGGGGGCGTIDDDEDESTSERKKSSFDAHSYSTATSNKILQCGWIYDDDAIDLQAMTWHLYHQPNWSTCSRIEIHGGGGGGGGTDLCCLPYEIDFGFGFSMYSSIDRSAQSTDDIYHDEEITDINASEATNEQHDDSLPPRYTYDLMGLMFNISQGICSPTIDWCCTCDISQQLVACCFGVHLNITSEQSLNDNNDINSTTPLSCANLSALSDYVIKSEFGGKFSFPTFCNHLRDHYQQFEWLLYRPCCSSTATTTPLAAYNISKFNVSSITDSSFPYLEHVTKLPTQNQPDDDDNDTRYYHYTTVSNLSFSAGIEVFDVCPGVSNKSSPSIHIDNFNRNHWGILRKKPHIINRRNLRHYDATLV
jgi:hypothetical protein